MFLKHAESCSHFSNTILILAYFTSWLYSLYHCYHYYHAWCKMYLSCFVFILTEAFQSRRDNNAIKTKLIQTMKEAENKSEVSVVCGAPTVYQLSPLLSLSPSRIWLQTLYLANLISPLMILRISSWSCVRPIGWERSKTRNSMNCWSTSVLRRHREGPELPLPLHSHTPFPLSTRHSRCPLMYSPRHRTLWSLADLLSCRPCPLCLLPMLHSRMSRCHAHLLLGTRFHQCLQATNLRGTQ